MEKYKKLLEGINEFGGWQRLGRTSMEQVCKGYVLRGKTTA